MLITRFKTNKKLYTKNKKEIIDFSGGYKKFVINTPASVYYGANSDFIHEFLRNVC